MYILYISKFSVGKILNRKLIYQQIEILVEKSKFWSKNRNFGRKIEIVIKNKNFVKNQKYSKNVRFLLSPSGLMK